MESVEKFILCRKTKKLLPESLSEFKEEEIHALISMLSKPRTYWTHCESSSDAVYLERMLGSEQANYTIEKYIFDIDNNKNINELQDNHTYLVCYLEPSKHQTNSGKIILVEHFENFNTVKDIEEFNKKNNVKYIFDICDDIFESSEQEFENQVKAREINRMRTVHFEDDIIITDPCYLIKKRDESTRPKWDDYMSYQSMYEYPDLDKKTNISKLFREEYEKLEKADKIWDKAHPDDYDICEEYEDMSKLGFEKEFLVRDTIYGDWSCTTFDVDTKKKLGKFCADSGMVCVCAMSDVRKYNPEFENVLKTAPHIATVIKNFNGDVCFKYTENGDEVYVQGTGNVNFKTKQTGL